MSKKLRNVRRELSGYKEPPAPPEKQVAFRKLKERMESGQLRFASDQRLFLDAEMSFDPSRFEDMVRLMSRPAYELTVRDGTAQRSAGEADELTFYDDAAMRRAVQQADERRAIQQADDAILYGTRRVEATYRGLQRTQDGVRPGAFFDGGVVTGRSVGRTATQMMEASRLRASELPAFLRAPEVEIDFGSISPRQAAQMLEYSQRDSAQGILAAYRQAYGDRLRVEVSGAARPEGFAHYRRDGFHVNDVSFVTVMREAARREGWDLARPRNVVPTGLSERDLIEFRRILSGIEEGFVGKDCLFLGFGPTRTLVFIAGPDRQAREPDTWCFVSTPVPFQRTRVEVHRHPISRMPTAPSPIAQARRKAFEIFDSRYTGAPAW